MDKVSRRAFLTACVTTVAACTWPGRAESQPVVERLGLKPVHLDADGYSLGHPNKVQCAQWLKGYRMRCEVVGKLRLDRILVRADEYPKAWLASQEEFRAMWDQFHELRLAVGRAQGLGYCAGRDGKSFMTCTIDGKPEHADEHHAWHNGWFLGEADRRRYG